jgi:hypothetical protein
MTLTARSLVLPSTRPHRGVICNEASKCSDVVVNRGVATPEGETDLPDHTPMRMNAQADALRQLDG